MKKAKIDIKVNEFKCLIFEYCKKKLLEVREEGFSLYISLGSLSFEEIKISLKEYLIKTMKMTEKKIKKFITFLSTNERIYILFKMKTINV
ncbi:MAG: hypothetical protein SPF22_08185 [Candidatus Onthovivens sp.]|nr:hypothetical protein [Candidatus Onthovivens sp.]